MLRTFPRRELVRFRIDFGDRNVFGAIKRLAAKFRTKVDRVLHEIRPDRQRGFGAGQTQLLVIIETNPHGTYQIRRVTDEPSIARRAGFAGNGSVSNDISSRARSAMIDDAFK